MAVHCPWQLSIVPPLSIQFSQKTLHRSRPYFMGSYLSTISPRPWYRAFFSVKHGHVFFSFFKISIFQFFKEFFSFLLAWDPMGANISKCYFPHGYHLIKMLAMEEYRPLLFLVICQMLKILWHFEIFHNTGSVYVVGKFKTLSLQFSSDLSQSNFMRTSLVWYRNTGYYFSWQSGRL